MPAITMESKLSAAVGGKAAKAFADAFGYETVGDLLRHYPARGSAAARPATSPSSSRGSTPR